MSGFIFLLKGIKYINNASQYKAVALGKVESLQLNFRKDVDESSCSPLVGAVMLLVLTEYIEL